jgi:hypothetical protein
MSPQPSPTVPNDGGALVGGEVGFGKANKRAGIAIGLTRGRLVSETWPGNDPVMAGGEATTAPPRRRGSRRM